MFAGLLTAGSNLTAQSSPDYPATIIAPFDSTYNRTVLQILPFSIDSTLALSAVAALIGRLPAAESEGGVVLTLWSSGDSTFNSPPVRFALVDSTILELGDAWSSPNPAEGYHEVMLVSLNLSTFRELVASPSTILLIRDRKFPISERHMNALRDFAGRIGSAID